MKEGKIYYWVDLLWLDLFMFMHLGFRLLIVVMDIIKFLKRQLNVLGPANLQWQNAMKWASRKYF